MKRDKSPKAQKVLKWHGNEEQRNIFVYHMLQSCGIQSISYLKTKVIMKLILWPRQSYLDFSNVESVYLQSLIIVRFGRVETMIFKSR